MQGQKSWNLASEKLEDEATYFPKKSLPSMITLTFLNPILARDIQGGGDRCKSFARVSRGL
jgi:hypothetical protein